MRNLAGACSGELLLTPARCLCHLLLPQHFRAAARSPAPHRDAAVVDVDVARSLWHFAPRASEDELEAQRAELKELLNGVCGANAGQVHYYQGLHDVASVLLLTLGQRAAFVALERLARTHLREYVRSDLSASLVRLELLPVLLRRVCAPLAEFCFERAGAPPHFALSWIITWFAHDCRDLEIAKRVSVTARAASATRAHSTSHAPPSGGPF